MNTRISLEGALKAWQDYLVAENGSEEHIPVSAMYELCLGGKIQEAMLEHLSWCPACLQELKEMVRCIKMADVWDMALPKAAASQRLELPKTISTEGGKYLVIIRRSLGETNRGLVTLQVRPAYLEQLEGRRIILRDGKGLVLLDGVIRGSQASQEVEDLDSIDPRFRVEPGEGEHE